MLHSVLNYVNTQILFLYHSIVVIQPDQTNYKSKHVMLVA
jgi:hypothetical protein